MLSDAREKIGFDKNPLSFLFNKRVKHIVGTKDNPVHEVERNLSLIKHFTDDGPAKVRLYPSGEDFAFVKRQTSNVKGEMKEPETPNSKLQTQNSKPKTQNLEPATYICVAPSSVWFTKQYPKEKWIGFLQQVPSAVNIFFLGAASDKTLCDEIIRALPDHSAKNLCGELSFLQSAALMKHAVMNYVNDSAPMHIASAMNAPVAAIFCSTVTWFGYWPLSDKSFVVERKEPLYCRPCTSHGKRYCPEKHFKCALDINKDQLLDTLNHG